MEINVYDMLVFEDENGSIFQDCVCNTCNRKFEYRNNNEDYLEIFTNRYNISIGYDGKIFEFYSDDGDYGDYIENVKLKEVWSRVDEDTYKKVWSEHLETGRY